MSRKIYKTGKVFLVLSMFFIFLGVNSAVVNAEVSDSAKIDFLVQRGASQSILDRLPSEKLDDLYSQVIEEDLYCKPCEPIEEVPSSPITRGAIEPSDLKLESFANVYVNSDNSIRLIFLEYEGKWAEGKPLLWHEDVVTANWKSSKFDCSFTEFYSEYYVYGDENSAHTAYYIESPAYAALQGVGYYVDLSRFDYDSYPTIASQIQNRGFYGLIELIPNTPVMEDKNEYLGVTVNYAHNINPLPISIGLVIGGVSVEIDDSIIGTYDTIGDSFSFQLCRAGE